jgi:Predicted metal-binding protein
MSLNDYLKCPELDRVANAVPEMRLCHKCGSDVEIWTDEKKGRCSKCGTMIKNRNLQPGDEKKSELCLQKTEPDLNLKELVRLAYSLGASDAQIISSDDILVENDLADLCKEPQCENYGLSLICPPHVSGLSGLRKLQKDIKHAVVVRIAVPSAALFSDERRKVMRLLHEVVAAVEQAAVRMGYSDSKAFAGGSCKDLFCHDYADCRVLSEGDECRYPQHARPSMSGFGINVSALMKVCGWPADINTREPRSGADAMSWVAGLVMVG